MLKEEIKGKGVTLAIGRACFVVCDGCYNFFSHDEMVSRKEIIRFAKYLINTKKIKKITVGGGDPLSREDIFDIVKDLKKLGFSINLDTIGLPLLKGVKIIKNGHGYRKSINAKEIMPFIDVIGLPIDGSTEEISYYFRRGRPKFLTEVEKTLSLLEKITTQVSINTVVHKLNYDDLQNIAKILLKYKNIFQWQLFQYMPIGSQGYINRRQFMISNKLFEDSIKKVKKYMHANNSNIIITPKNRSQRKNVYLIIDSNGTAWCPKTSDKSPAWICGGDMNMDRVIWGNIKDEKTIPSIVSNSFKYQGDPN
jgi:MoaA/NifB/PqqE/SkfB family radical SAM enzyme